MTGRKRRTELNVINYFDSDRKEHWLAQIAESDWSAGPFLCKLLREGTFFDAVGQRSRVLLLTEGDELISYCTYAEKDDVQPTDLTPWVGFVYTFPRHRGRRCAGLLLAEAERLAGEEGVRAVYLSTNHVGLYEKYGFEYFTQMTDLDGKPTRVYVKRIDPMTEREKMLAGQLYDPTDPELTRLRIRVRKLARRYNQTDEDDPAREALLRELLPASPHLPELQAPAYFDYGCNTVFGKNCFANFNFTCLDVCPVRIGESVMIGPNVTLATPLHPLLPEERSVRQRPDGSVYDLEYAKPITIADGCWLGANVVVCGGVHIGEGSVVGAGSVVTRDVPPRGLAAGNPCQVIRALTDADAMG